MTNTAQISITQDGDVTKITCGGTLDLTNYQQLHDGLKTASKEAEAVTVDLRETMFIDTAVVQDLARAAITLINRGKRLSVFVIETAHPYRVLKISGFQQIMDIEVE